MKYSFRKKILSRILQDTIRNSAIDDFEEQFNLICKNKGKITASCWYWIQIICLLPSYFKNSTYWSTIMFNNYVKVAFRNIAKYRLFSSINIYGLAIGISTCMMIYFWVQQELSYDSFHKNGHRIYRIERELFRDNLYSRWPIVGGSYKQALIDDFPEVENAMRLWRREFAIKDHRNYTHRHEMFAVDNSIFQIFDFGLEEGDPETALTDPKTVVLTRENAKKYFGTDDVIGKSLSFELNGEQTDFKVTGILQEVPKNSHVHFDMLISISTYPAERFREWRSNYLYTYVLLNENTKKSELEGKLKSFVSNRLESNYGDLLSQGLSIHEVLKMHLFPITDIHLNPSINWEIEAGGNTASVYIFSSIAILILIIACINFINLSTARANKRAKEVGLRKTIGADKNQLRIQFLQESILLAGIALVLAIILLSLFIPVYNSIFGEQLSTSLLLQGKNILFLLGITLTAGLFAGLYPAFYLTRFQPIGVLKGSVKTGKEKSGFRRNMVVFQLVISIVLIIGMFTVYKQMNFIQNRSLGFDKENVVILPVRGSQFAQGYQSFRNELMASSQIISAARSADVPSERIYGNTNFRQLQKTDDPVSIYIINTDYDFVDTYKMELAAGRNFSEDFGTDTTGTLILNEAAANRIGWTAEEAIGKDLVYARNAQAKVVGVVKNFNYKSAREEIEPLVLVLSPDYFFSISVRIAPGDVRKTLDFVEQKWATSFPGELFQYSFLDQRINQLYESEQRMQSIFLVFSCFSIFVACLGLFGLAAFTAEVRTKEIGIRKVLGASTRNVILLLSNEFTKWIILANIIAWPLAWFFMNKWMQNFVFKADIGWSVFLMSGVLALIIAVVTFSFQAIKAAFTNPADTLKYE
jgi:putative ABC transport system permease protein